MLRKLLKYVLWTLGGLIGLLLLISVLLYLPPVQRFAVSRIAGMVESSTGMNLTIGTLRVRFPLRVEIVNLLATKPYDSATIRSSDDIPPLTDTVLYVSELRTRVSFLPIFGGRILANNLDVHRVVLGYSDPESGLNISGSLDTLSLSRLSLGLGNNRLELGTSLIAGADARVLTFPGTKAETPEADSTAGWHIESSRLDLRRISFAMRTSPETVYLNARLPEASILDADINLETQNVRARDLTVHDAVVRYLTDTLTIAKGAEALADSIINQTPLPWTVRVDKIEITADTLDYGVMNGIASVGLDFDNISLRRLFLAADSVYNRRSEVSFNMRDLRFAERSGFELTAAKGYFSMDTASLELKSFELNTVGTNLKADADADIGLIRSEPDASLEAFLSGYIATADLFTLFPQTPQIQSSLKGKTLLLDGRFSGSLENLLISNLDLNLPGDMELHASGNISSLTQSDLTAQLDFEATLIKPDLIKGFISDTSLRRRFDFPDITRIEGSASISADTYTPDIIIRADSGYLHIDGMVNTRSEIYSATVKAQSFPVYKFLPADSLGLATMVLDASGNGFDPTAEGASSDIILRVERFDYMRYSYGNIALDAKLAQHNLGAQLTSRNDGLDLDLNVDAQLYPRSYSGNVYGRFGDLDLYKLNLSREPLGAAFVLDAKAGYYPDTTYSADIVIDSARLVHGKRIDRIGRSTITATADQEHVQAAVNTGDMSLDFTSSDGLDSLIRKLTLASEQVQAQIDSASINMELIRATLPSFRLRAKAGSDNVFHDILADNGMGLGNIRVSAAADSTAPFHAWININGYRTGKLTLDSLNVGLRQNGEALNYFLRLRNRPGNIEQMAFIRVTGSAVGNEASANFYQRDRADSVGFDFGIKAELLDSAVRVEMTDLTPTFGYIPWSANEGNYVEYHFNNEVYADMRLDGNAQHFYIESAPIAGMPRGAVEIDMEGIDIGQTLSLLPSPPPLSGVLSADLRAGLRKSMFAAEGTLSIQDFAYDGRRVGNIGLDVDFQSDSGKRTILKGDLLADGNTVLALTGDINSGEQTELDIDARIPGLPLTLASAFLPEELVAMEGTLSGNASIDGTFTKPLIDGSLAFNSAKLTVPIIGTSYGISSTPVTFDRSLVSFNNFSLTAPNNQPLTLDGTTDIGDLNAIAVDLDLYGTNFQAVKSTSSGGSQIYGSALLDIDVTAQGELSAIAVRGDVNVLNGTDLTYTVEDTAPKAESQKQDIVTFVSFADSALMATLDSVAIINSFGADVLVNVEIDDNVQIALNLSSDGSNRVELQGEGNLSYAVNTQGDARFTGRYTLTGGTVVYSPPIITAKNFAIDDGSYVEWTGDMLNPSFHITATQTVRTTVTSDDNTSRTVNFDIKVMIGNTLEDLALTFDLSAPGDLAIQNELSSLAPEQRSTQAMALLVYNTYTGPGTTAKVDSNNPLNTFIEREINSWARNSLPGVDLAIGINSVDDNGGGQHTDYSYKVSKSLFDDRVKVTIGGSLNPEDSATDNLANNFVDDVSLEYRLNKRDNMFLKAYRYNTQESILEGEVVETGVGFVARKKVNKLKELFRFSPSPAKKQARRQRRELRRELKEEEINQETGGQQSGDGSTPRPKNDPAKEQRQDNPLSPQEIDKNRKPETTEDEE